MSSNKSKDRILADVALGEVHISCALFQEMPQVERSVQPSSVFDDVREIDLEFLRSISGPLGITELDEVAGLATIIRSQLRSELFQALLKEQDRWKRARS